MKIFNILILIFTTTLFISCSDDGNETPKEGDCTSEVTFTEDGVSVTMPIGGLGEGAKAAFALKDPSPFNAQEVSRAFALRLQSGLMFFDVVLELNVADADSCIPVGVYDVNTLPGSDGVLSFLYTKGLLESYVIGLGEGSGTLEITKCDLENKLISGRFSGTMARPLGNETIEIRNGVFENVCLFE